MAEYTRYGSRIPNAKEDNEAPLFMKILWPSALIVIVLSIVLGVCIFTSGLKKASFQGGVPAAGKSLQP